MMNTTKKLIASFHLIVAVARSKLKIFFKVNRTKNYVLNNQYFANCFEVIGIQ